MCIMASPVRSVSDTRIFVGTNGALTQQLTVYQMAVQLSIFTGKGNAMILPVPVGTAGAKSIKLVDLSAVPTFFEPFVAAFKEQSRGFGMSKGISRSLEVQRVGNYDVSVVPTVDDVKRLNRNVFEVSPDTEAVLRTEYPVGFAFLVAQLRESGNFHPLAYLSPVVGGKMFVPTRHAHGPEKGLPKWDHLIFYRGKSAPDYMPQDQRNFAFHKSLPADTTERSLAPVVVNLATHLPALVPFLGAGLGLNQVRAQGPLPNVDLTVPV